MMDQGTFAISNFALNVLLARWLTPQEYGAFAVAFTVMLLLGTFHSALFIEPMLVFGPGRYKEHLSEYLGVLVYGHWSLAVPAGGTLLLAVGLGLGVVASGALSTAFVGLALAGPLIFYLWLMRRACYVRLEPRLAATGGALYMMLMLVGSYVAYRSGILSTATALGVLGLSSLVVALWLSRRLGVGWRLVSEDSGLRGETFRSHLDYGRWAVLTSALMWVPGNAYYLLLPIWGGLEASASLRALMNLVMPVLQANSALSVLLLPVLVQARGGPQFGRLVRAALVFFSVSSLLYWVILGLFQRPLVNLLYGGQYSEHAGLLWLIGLMPLASAVGIVLGGALRAIERPDRVFWAYMFSGLATLIVGLGLVFLWGITGAVTGLLLSYVVAAVAMCVCYLRTADPFEPAEAGDR